MFNSNLGISIGPTIRLTNAFCYLICGITFMMFLVTIAIYFHGPKEYADTTVTNSPTVPKNPTVSKIPSVPENPTVSNNPTVPENPNVQKNPTVPKNLTGPENTTVAKSPTVTKDMKRIGYEIDMEIDPNIRIPKVPLDYLDQTKGDISKEETYKVPNIVHYCWYTKSPLPLRFIDYLGMMSAYKMLKPDVVYVHLNQEPTGPYWVHFKELPRVIVDVTEWPTKILGETVKKSDYYTGAGNICRNHQIYENGGIYLDMDVVILKSFDELRKYSCTVGQTNANHVGGGVIVCEKKAMFMKLWANAYLDDYQPHKWGYNSGVKPLQLSKRFPELVHVLPREFNKPSWEDSEIGQIWGKETWDWKINYAVHTWVNRGLKVYREAFNDPDFTLAGVDNLDKMGNCTFKTIAQYVIAA